MCEVRAQVLRGVAFRILAPNPTTLNPLVLGVACSGFGVSELKQRAGDVKQNIL